MSDTTKAILDKSFDGWFMTEYRGPIEMKGKGLVSTYWLNYEKMSPDDSSGFTELDHHRKSNQSLPVRENYNFHHRSSRLIDVVHDSFDHEPLEAKFFDEMHPKLDSGFILINNFKQKLLFCISIDDIIVPSITSIRVKQTLKFISLLH